MFPDEIGVFVRFFLSALVDVCEISSRFAFQHDG